ncbi:EcoKI restriction-modification system protein HsdS [Pseudomonas sp. DD1]|uniref:restriction endonuclease subunit S n=1 Tax=Pseudomonas sp. DD1 TaxID=879558 RepID=UPI0037C6F78C
MSLPTYPGYKDSGVDWLGTVPEHWDSKRLKFLFDLVKREIREEDRIVTCFRDGAVTLRDNRRTDGFTNAVKEIGYQGIRVGDLVIHAMDAFAGAIGVSDSDGKSTPVYSVCTPVSPSVSSNYYARLLRNMAVAGFVSSLAKGIRERSTDFRWADAGEIFLPVPSETEQRKIVSFLDHETARIDALIEEQRRLIELLKEKRQAVISHAVTKGLDPTVPMKDSGVEWLGEVPAHWAVSPLKFLVEEKVAGPYGASLTKSMYTDSGYRVYGQQQIISDDFAIGDYYISEEKFSEMQRYVVFPGDVLVSVMGTIGRVSVVPVGVEVGIINPRLVRYKFASSKVVPEFVKILLMSLRYQSRLREESQGSTMEGLNMAILGDLPLVSPPLDTQYSIVAFVKNYDSNFNELVSQATSAVDLLQERRSALISVAVTGKIDVRGWQPPTRAQAPESLEVEAV